MCCEVFNRRRVALVSRTRLDLGHLLQLIIAKAVATHRLSHVMLYHHLLTNIEIDSVRNGMNLNREEEIQSGEIR